MWVCFGCKLGLSGPHHQLSLLRARFGAAQTRKVVKIRPKDFSTVLTKKDKNCTRKSVVMFRLQTDSSRPDFQLCLLLCYTVPKKSSKFDRNIFQLYWPKTIRAAPQTTWLCFCSKTEFSGPDFQLSLFRVCSGSTRTRKVVKI